MVFLKKTYYWLSPIDSGGGGMMIGMGILLEAGLLSFFGREDFLPAVT